MSDIFIKTKAVKSEVDILKDCSKTLENAVDAIEKINRNILLGSSSDDIQKQLEMTGTALGKQKDNLKSMAEQLGEIVKAYERVEGNIKENEIKKIGLTAFEISIIMAELGELIGSAAMEALTGKDTNWQEWIQKYVPENVSDAAWIALYFLTSMHGMSVEEMNAHRENNEREWEKYQEEHKDDKYIEEQNDMSNMQYGDYSGDRNTCGVIATYNALQSLTDGNSPDDLPDLIAHYEEKGIAANGAIGTAPDAINDYFEQTGYDTKMLVGDGISSLSLSDMSTNYETYIMLSYNNESNVMSGLHYLSITCENGEYVIHNDGSSEVYATLDEAVNGYNGGKGEPITVIGIRQ